MERNMMECNVSEIIEILHDNFMFDKRTTLNRMREHSNPFEVLIGCMVSINIKDEVTDKIVKELFLKARNFQEIIDIDDDELERILYLARYRKVKAARLKSVSREIIERFDGMVPSNEEDLLSIKGIGPKTCDIVLNFAFNHNRIPVDSNTIRISNRFGWITSKKAEEVKEMLIHNLKDEQIRDANGIFMLFGKNICLPTSPYCSKCPVNSKCLKVDIKNSR